MTTSKGGKSKGISKEIILNTYKKYLNLNRRNKRMFRAVIIIVFGFWFYQKLQTMELSELIDLIISYLNSVMTSIKNILTGG